MERDKVLQEANRIADKLKTSLSYSLSSTRTLAFAIEKYGEPKDFDAIAKSILQTNPFIDAVELTRQGVITNVYPLQGNEPAIGYDVLAASVTRDEALKALRARKLFFAGPFTLKQGGFSVVGRLPIFRDSTFWGFSVVLIKFTTLLKSAGISKNNNFDYQLSKKNPVTGKEEFLMEGEIKPNHEVVSIEVPDGLWDLYVISKRDVDYVLTLLPMELLGLLFSVTAGLLIMNLVRQPYRLKKKVQEVTAEMEAYQESASASLRHVNRLFHFTSRVNDMAVHVADEQTLYSQACKIAVEIGKYKMAWVGVIENGAIHAFCSAGEVIGYLQDVTPIDVTNENLKGPARMMLETGTFFYCNDIGSDPFMKPWADKALSRGYRSLIILPIKKSGIIVASYNLYSDKVSAFDEIEIQLLLETTENISFVLDTFEKDRQRKQVENQIQTEKFLSDSIINSMPGIFYLYDENRMFQRWNRNFELVSGYSAEEIKKMHPLDFFHGEDKVLLEAKIQNVFNTGYDDVIANFYTKHGTTIPYFFNGKKVEFNGSYYLLGMGLDVTDRMRAERELRERAEEIEKLTDHLQHIREEERSKIALEIHDVLGQQLTALKMDAAWIKKKTSHEQTLQERVAGMITVIDETIKTVRKISSELRPGILDDLGLVAALEWQGSEFEKNTGIAVKFLSDRSEVSLDRNFATNVFRIYQEALTNVARHSHASSVLTKLSCNHNLIRLEVIDNGIGIDLDEVKKQKSIGLISMKERARYFHGEVKFEKNIPTGTSMIFEAPLLSKTVSR